MVHNRSNGELSERPAAGDRKNGRRVLFGGLFLLALCAVVRYYWGADPVKAESADNAARTGQPARTAPRAAKTSRQAPAAKSAPEAAKQASVAGGSTAEPMAIVATVNTQRIGRKELAQECRRRYGAEVLESMVNKYLIQCECDRLGIRVTRTDVDAEIKRMAERFNIPVDQWLKLIKDERNITPSQYAEDIIWPTLALRKLAGERLAVSRQELETEYDVQYGEQIRARLIAVADPQKAKELQAQAAANPDEFGNLAKNHSEDAPSASAKGMIQPIRKHGSYQQIEDAVFNMEDGQVSPVIEAGGQYVILKREGLVPARKVNFEEAAPKLTEIIRDRKLRSVSQDTFQDLQKNAQIENVWNDPKKHEKMPEIAATVNGNPISINALDEECILRHGQDTLEGMISRKLLEQACQRRTITVTDQEIDAEIARAALVGVKPLPDGSPDVATWLELIAKKQGVAIDVYRKDIVWPAVAMKKLVGDKIEVTEADLKKGFEANYGPRVRCLAIVLDNQRRAQQVFEMARKQNTAEYFGDLAAQYSIEAGSKELRGEVPPIRKHGGQPLLEEEAFSLKPGELSGVIQVDDKFIILRCEEFTKPDASTTLAEVRDLIYEDIYEKKLRAAMTTYFDDLRESATIDNYLAGTSHSPKDKNDETASRNLPQLRQVPGE